MNYKVIHNFFDLQDNDHSYQVGDKFPRQGAVANENRLKELSSKNNRLKKPLIELVKVDSEPVEEPPKKRGRKPKED